jgi:hypothetical protein
LTYDSIVANGVDLGTLAIFQVGITGSTKVPVGTVFKIIKNVSTTPITGAFFNQPEGSIVSFGPLGKLQVSYAGGDGNDLTLTCIR